MTKMAQNLCIKFNKKFSLPFSQFQYSGSDNTMERINGTGPLRADIHLHVLSVGNLAMPNIHYRFMEPISAAAQPQQQQPVAESAAGQQQQQQQQQEQRKAAENAPPPKPPTHFHWRHMDQWSEVSVCLFDE